MGYPMYRSEDSVPDSGMKFDRSATDKSAPIHSCLQDLYQELLSLRDEISRLEDRLAPVLTPVEAMASDVKDFNEDPHIAVGSDMKRMLLDHLDVVRGARRRLGRLSDRLEV